jgi:hypothetical protein
MRTWTGGKKNTNTPFGALALIDVEIDTKALGP